MPYKPYVFCVNPNATSNYRKSYIGMEKTDPTGAYLIADFGRVGRTKKLEPWRRAVHRPETPYKASYAPFRVHHQGEDLYGL